MSEDTPGGGGGSDDEFRRISFVRHDTMDKSTASPTVALQVIGGTRPSQTSEQSISGSSGVKEFFPDDDGGGHSSSSRKSTAESKNQTSASASSSTFGVSYRDRQKFLMDDGDSVAHRWTRMQDSLADGVEEDDDDFEDDDEVGYQPQVLCQMIDPIVSGLGGVGVENVVGGGGGRGRNFLLDDDDVLAPFPRVSSSQILYETKRKPPKLVGNYLIGDQLGEGSYGKVKEALECECLCRRAVKILKERKLRKIPNGEQDVQREIRLLKRLRHRNVIRLFDVLKNESKLKMYLFIEYCVGSLQEMLDSAPGKKFPIWQAHLYFVQLLDGLQYLHGQSVVHKDIKPGNLLLTTDETLKITDLGVAEDLGRYETTDLCFFGRGTPKFQPPEIAGGQSKFFGFPVDVWASGVTLYNLVSGLYPYEGENVYKLFDNITKQEVRTPPDVDATLEDLLKGMLCKQVSQRFTLQHVRKHVWSTKKHPQTLIERVPLPPYKGDPTRYMTVYGYLEQMYGPQSSTSSVDGVQESPPAGQLTVMSERAYVGGGGDKKLTFGGSVPETLNTHHSSAAAATASTTDSDTPTTQHGRFKPSLVRKSSSEPRTNKLNFSGKSKPKVNFCKIQ